MVVTHAITVGHAATANMADWEKYRQIFVNKYKSSLPLMEQGILPGQAATGWEVHEVPHNAKIIPPWFLQLRQDWARSIAEGKTPQPQEMHPLAKPMQQ